MIETSYALKIVEDLHKRSEVHRDLPKYLILHPVIYEHLCAELGPTTKYLLKDVQPGVPVQIPRFHGMQIVIVDWVVGDNFQWAFGN